MNDKILAALNDQVWAEFVAFYTYLSMSAWLEANDWPGFAQWMRQHSAEEQMHAMKIYDFINERNGKVALQAIDQPPTEFNSVQEVFETALEHERHVTARINDIYRLAQEEGDYPTQVLMEWFINEQVEEEKIVEDALVMVKRAGDNPFQLMYVDQIIGQQAAAGGEAAGGEAPA
ncbi:MAG: ferritin [Caldilineae bacterium]|nr:MAG: ferritin [Caldilineae bacterium]